MNERGNERKRKRKRKRKRRERESSGVLLQIRRPMRHKSQEVSNHFT